MTDTEIQDELNKSLVEWDKIRRRRAIKAMFERDSININLEDEKYLMRGFLWIKGMICLLLNRTYGSYLNCDAACILTYDESHVYESMSWESVWVSRKIFSSWQVCICQDGT